MPIVKSLLLLSVSLLLGCQSFPEDIRTRADVPDCKQIGSLRGLRIYIDQSGKTERIEFVDQSLKRSVVPEETWKGAPTAGSRWASESSLSEAFAPKSMRLPEGGHPVLPVAVSSSAKLAAAGIALRDNQASPEGVVIRQDGNFRRINGTPGYSVGSLAWSPDSSRLAVVEYNYKLMTRSFRDFVSPHPVPYSDMLLTVYKASGEAICQSGLVADARYGTSKIEWLRQ